MPVSTGTGTDVFVKKTQPGAAVGVGYFVDIYENGIKTESFRAPSKKMVNKIIKDFKEKYHTDRAFQNENQVHITYKSKEERGETAMENLDQELIKKANKINIALQKLITPYLPVKVRQAEIPGSDIVDPNKIDFIPQTPGGSEGVMTDDEIGMMVATKFITFVSNSKPQQGQEWPKSDDLYNPLKKWLTAIKKKIQDYVSSNNATVDLNKVSEIAEGIVLSGDPNTIKEKTKMSIDADVASKVKEIGSMKAGIPKKKEGSIVKVSNDNEEHVDIFDIKEEELDSDEEKQFGDENADVTKDLNKRIESFFNYIRSNKKSGELNRIFEEWLNIEKLTAKEASEMLFIVSSEDFVKRFGITEENPIIEVVFNNLSSGKPSHAFVVSESKVTDNYGQVLIKLIVHPERESAEDNAISSELEKRLLRFSYALSRREQQEPGTHTNVEEVRSFLEDTINSPGAGQVGVADTPHLISAREFLKRESGGNYSIDVNAI